MAAPAGIPGSNEVQAGALAPTDEVYLYSSDADPDPVGGCADTLGNGKHGGGSVGRRGFPQTKVGTPTTKDDGLDGSTIRRYIRRNSHKFAYCYEKALIDRPALAGKVTVTFTITADGKVADARGTGLTGVAACVACVIGAIEFPRPKNQRSVGVTYPFTFAPTGG